jgi:hypothetical protein
MLYVAHRQQSRLAGYDQLQNLDRNDRALAEDTLEGFTPPTSSSGWVSCCSW